MTAEELNKIIAAAVKEWTEARGNNTELRKYIFEKLDQALDNLLFDAIGIDTKWQEWRFKRDGSSNLIRDAITPFAKEQASSIIEELLPTHTILISETAKKQLIKACKEELEYNLRYKISELIDSRLEVIAEEVLEQAEQGLKGVIVNENTTMGS
jgi:hypothetical protein